MSRSGLGVDWTELVSRIRRGDESGMEDLYGIFARGVRFYLCRQLGPQDLDDKVHDTFLIVVQAIRRGDLREPERLMGFVRTVVRRQVAAHIDQVVHSRREELHLDVGVRVADGRHDPEQSAASRQKIEFMRGVLHERDRDVLTRFYLYEQSQVGFKSRDVFGHRHDLCASEFLHECIAFHVIGLGVVAEEDFCIGEFEPELLN